VVTFIIVITLNNLFNYSKKINLKVTLSIYIVKYMLEFQEFSSMNEMFQNNGWNLYINEKEHFAYTRDGYETEYFEIKKKYKNGKCNYEISFPLMNSTFQYKTTISDSLYTRNYLADKFKEYIKY
jgi:hypothetical protein